MTLPRPILPGGVYLITRRCTQRQYLLRPDGKTNQAFLYCLGVAAKRFDIQIVGWMAMSNHYHAVVNDPRGVLPHFVHYFHQMLAKVLNVRWSRWENLWSTEPPTYTRLVNPSDVFDKLLYLLVNPVVDHLVDAVTHWPGSSSWRQLDGRALIVRRPHFFFRRSGDMPESVTIETSVPLGFEDNHETWHRRVREAVLAIETEVSKKRHAEGRRVLGRKKILAASAFERPKTSEPRRTLRPNIACKDKEHRVAAIRALRRFRAAHREARRCFAEGQRDTAFPAGTFALRHLGVVVAAPT